MKTIFFASILCLSFPLLACDVPTVDILVIGDSQTGASWSQSYFGNFLQECLGQSFVTYGRGGSVPSNWVGRGGLDNIETIQRDPTHPQLNIGSGEQVPSCKKRLEPMLAAHNPKRVVLFFGDNLIASSDAEILDEANKIVSVTEAANIPPQDCFFLTPTYEMEVATKRNVTRKNYDNTFRINALIKKAVGTRCQVIDGLELMKESPYYLEDKLLKRVQVEGKVGCAGAAKNDNIHICGEAARDMARKVCELVHL